MNNFKKIGVTSLALAALATFSSALADNGYGGYNSAPSSATQGYYQQQFPSDYNQGGAGVNVYEGQGVHNFGGAAEYHGGQYNEGRHDEGNFHGGDYNEGRRDEGRGGEDRDRGHQMNRRLITDAGMQATSKNADPSTDPAFQVRRALQADSTLSINARNIQVSVDGNKEITLSGTVKDDAEKNRVESIAKKVTGIQDVTNNLRIAGS